MFWSKIWFFLIALAAGIALTVALVLPRPAGRAHQLEEHQRLVVGCGVVDILLKDAARARVDLANAFSRAPDVVAKLDEASGVASIDKTRSSDLRSIASAILTPKDGPAPDLAILVDRRGRAVTRLKVDEDRFDDVVAGRPLIDDALAGYVRDDLWVIGGRLYLVAAAPVVRRDAPAAYVGAAVVGYAVTNKLAEQLVSSLNLGISFYLGGETVASSRSIALDRDAMTSAYGKITGGVREHDCEANQPFNLKSGNDEYTAVVARLPGEAETKQAYYALFVQRPTTIGFAGTLHAVRQSDLSPSSFPWVLVGGGLLAALAIGIALMIIESDRPLRKLNNDALRLAKGETPRMTEEDHRGKFGSIARSVNIFIDKLSRESKAAKQDLDQLLGPSSSASGSNRTRGPSAGGFSGVDLLGPAPAPTRAGAPLPASPSEFKFGDPPPSISGISAPQPPPPAIPSVARHTPGLSNDLSLPPPKLASSPAIKPPPPTPQRTSSPAIVPPAAPPAIRAINDDILDSGATIALDPGDSLEDASYFREVFEQFVNLKKSCGETVAGLTYEKFAEKLRKNRDDLVAKTACKQVKFTVYVKDGKAALKATPVKDEA